MTETVPFGEAAGPNLAFEAVGALQQPERIAREVVAMLNTDGGDLWVGLEEMSGRAARATPVDHDARRRVLDILVQFVEPAIGEDTCEVTEVPVEGGAVLRVRVRADASGRPYALVRQGAREFVMRTSDRMRPMSREELETLLRETPPPSADLSRARRSLIERRDSHLSPGLWVGVAFAPAAHLKLEPSAERILSALRGVSSRSDGAQTAFHLLSRYGQPVLGAGEVEIETPHHSLLLRESGSSDLHVSADRLRGRVHGVGGDDRAIDPNVLINYGAALTRLYGTLIQQDLLVVSPESGVLLDAALRGVQGARMADPAPSYGIIGRERSLPGSDPDLVFEGPMELPARELTERPDRCAFLLISRIYHAFGLESDAIPYYRRDLERFVFDP